MSKKKAIKITTATAIAASAFVAVAPTQSEAATSSVDKAITKATNQMAKAYDTYHKTAKNENKLPKTATIRKEVKLAQDYYAAATKEIAKNGGSKTKKAAFTKKLDTKKKYLNRAEAYLAAINTNLNPAKTAFKTAVEAGKAKNVVTAKAALVKDVEAFEAIVAKIYGPDVRGLLLEKYATPATDLANSVNDELKVYAAYKAIEAGKFADLVKTEELIKEVKTEADALKTKTTKLATTLAAVVAKNDAKFEEIKTPAVKEVQVASEKTVEVTLETAKTDLTVKNFTVLVDGKEVTPTEVKSDATGLVYTLTVAGLEGKDGKVSINGKEAAFEFAIPKVEDVKAINGKDLEVTFSKSVDKLTAETKANYEISINNASALAAGSYTVAVDEEDTKKVHVTLADGVALDNGAYVSVKVKKAVSDTNLKPLNEDVTKTLTFVDNTSANIQKVEVDGNDLKVTFNDYVSAVGLVKVDGVTKTAVIASPYSKTVVVTNGAQGLSNGTYNVQFANVEDIANIVGPGSTNATTFTSGNFTISSDSISPIVSKVEKVDQDTFKLTFNKAVTAPTVTIKKNGLDLTPAVVATNDAKVWTVNVSDNGGVKVYNDGESTVTLTANISGFKATSNNVVGDVTTQTVTLSKDTTGPVVETRFNEIADTPAAGTNEVFNIKFNEVITAQDAGKIVLTDKDGIRKAISSATIVADANGDNTILQVESSAVQTAGVINDGTYKLALGAGTVKDTAANDSAATTVTITKSGAAASDLTVTATASGNVITIPYGTPMGNSALELANYKIDNAALPAGSTVYFDGTKNTVKIELPAGSIAKTESVILTVSPSVIAESGAKLTPASRNQVVSGLVDNVKPTLVSAKKLTATTIEATFSENLDVVANSATSQNDFVVKVNGVPFTVTAVTDGARDNKVVLTVADFNVDQNVTVTMADSAIEIADIATNTAVAKTSVTATK